MIRWQQYPTMFSFMFVINAIDNVDANLRKHIYRFRQRVYKIENILIKCLTNYNGILNGPCVLAGHRHCIGSNSSHTFHQRIYVFKYF